MNKFKKGDLVICIGMYKYYADKCELGRTYIVEKAYANRPPSTKTWIELVNHPNSFEEKYFMSANVINKNIAKVLNWNTDK